MKPPGPRRVGAWVALTVLSGLLSWGLEAVDVPAAFLLGPMLTAIAFGVLGSGLTVPRAAFWGAQAVIGCLVANAVSAAILLTMLQDWLPMLAVVATTVAAGGIVGWTMAKFGRLPGTTAAWGSSPGAAAAMVAMADDFGADVRLVAFMQYLRMVLVVVSAALVSRLLLGTAAIPTGAPPPVPAGTPLALAETLAVAAGGIAIGRRFGIPSGAMLVPMILGAVLQGSGLIRLDLPPALLAIAYAGLGWYVGLQFTRAVLLYALRALPQLLLAILALIGLCGLSAWMLTALVGASPLTAYLATSPGGLDSITVIAIGAQADVPFVLALQTLRLFIVILTGPLIAKLICRAL